MDISAAVLVVLLVVLIFCCMAWFGGAVRSAMDAGRDSFATDCAGVAGGRGDHPWSAHTTPPLHASADVDPIVTGILYGHRDHTRDVYAGSGFPGEMKQGLAEYGSGLPGEVGVDVGPAQDDGHGGIPAEWRLPSEPLRWYKPLMRDHYGPEGPTPYTDNLYALTEPDHEPVFGADP